MLPRQWSVVENLKIICLDTLLMLNSCRNISSEGNPSSPDHSVLDNRASLLKDLGPET